MKKRIIGTFLVLNLFAGALPVLAQDASSTPASDLIAVLKAQVEALQAQIVNLQTQVLNFGQTRKALQPATREIKSTIVLIRQLRRGMSGEDIATLQEILATDLNIYPEGLVTGFFGPLTEKAVQKFQEKYGIETVGEVGPQTRGVLNSFLNKGSDKADKVAPGLLKKFDISDSTSTPGLGFGRVKVEICHKGQSLTIAAPAVNAHLGHGDTVGSCGGNGNGDNGGGEADVTPPLISGLVATSTLATSTLINWNTDETADSKVWYSSVTPVVPFASTTLMVSDNNLVTLHSLNLSPLSASTTYYYVAVSKDAAGNTATSSENSFTTN